MNDEALDTETRSAFEAGEMAATIKNRLVHYGTEDDPIPIALVNDNQRLEVSKELMGQIDKRRVAPRRRSGCATMKELDSFVAHVNRFKSASSAIFADVDDLELLAIYDYYPAGGGGPAAWCAHRASYSCPTSAAWDEWTNRSGRPMHQDDFADFIDDRLEDVVAGDGYPLPAKLLETARSLRINTKGTFSRRVHPTTGDFELVSKQETGSDSTPIPRAFLIGVPVFIGGAVYRIEARIRFKLRDGKATFAFELHRRAEIVRDAFGEVRDIAADKTELPVFAGGSEI